MKVAAGLDGAGGPLAAFALFSFGAYLEIQRLVDAHRVQGSVVDRPILVGVVLGVLSVLAPLGWRSLPRGRVRRVTGWMLVAWIAVLTVGLVLTHYGRIRAAAEGQPALVHPFQLTAVACWTVILVVLLVVVPVLAWRHPGGPGTRRT